MFSEVINQLCEQRVQTSCYGSNHAAVLLPPGKGYCLLPKGAKLWGE